MIIDYNNDKDDNNDDDDVDDDDDGDDDDDDHLKTSLPCCSMMVFAQRRDERNGKLDHDDYDDDYDGDSDLMVVMIMMEMLGVFSTERCGEKVKVDGKLIFNIPWCLW